MAGIDEIIKKQKEHLTKAQIRALAKAAERYKQYASANRAEAYGSLHKGLSSTRRNLQNMGLAGRHGKLISGAESAARATAERTYSGYNQQLNKVSDAYTRQAAARMARENQIQEYLDDLKKQQEEINAQIEQYKKEAAKANAAQQVQNAVQQAAAAAQAAAARQANQNRQTYANAKNGLWNLAMTDTGTSGVPRTRLADRVRNAVNNVTNTVKNAGKPLAKAAAAMPQKRTTQLQNAIQTAINSVYSANIAQKQVEINAKMPEWENAIKEGAAARQMNPRDTASRMERSEALRKEERARKEMAKAQSDIARYRVASKVSPTIGEKVVLPDDEFDVRYDAAVKAYENALKRERETRGDNWIAAESDAYSMQPSTHPSAEKELERATTELAYFEYAKKLRTTYSQMGYFYDSITPSNAAKKYEGRSTEGVYTDPRSKTYDKEHGTERSKYAAIINELSQELPYTKRAYQYTFRGKLDFDNDGYREFESRVVAAYGDKIAPDAKTVSAQYDRVRAAMIAASYMTQNEKDRYNTILADYGVKKADEYFDYLYENVLVDRVSQAIDEDYDATLRRTTKYDDNGNRIGAEDGKMTWLAQATTSALSIPVNLIEGAVEPISTLINRQSDPVTARMEAIRGNSAQNMRNAVQENFGDVGKFFYGTGMSMADSATVAAISGGLGKLFVGMGIPASMAGKAGSVLGGSILGGSAFNSAYADALDKGLSPDKARQTAVGQGINEMLFESLSLDLLVGQFQHGGVLKVSKNGFVNWLVNTMVQGGVEGSEEVFTDMANNLWDKGVNGIYSEELTKLREYISQGMSYEEAKRKVNAEFAEQLGMSFLGGFVSGGVMGGGATFMGMVQNRGNEKVGNGLRQNSRVMNELRNFDFKSEYAKEILQQKNLTNADVADLFNIRQQELLSQYKSDIQKAVADGSITQEQADLLKQYEQNGVQIVKDGEVVANENGITVEQMPSVQDAIANLDNAARIQFLNNEETRSLVQAVGGETAAVIEQSETAEREAERAYRQTVREINNDTTLSTEQKQKRLEAADRTRQNAQSEASKIADTALTNKKGIGAKLETDGNGTVKVGKKSGKVTYDFSTKGNPGHQAVDSMTATEQSALRIAKIVAASRPDVNVKVEAEFVGEHANENGYYDRSTNTIHINMSGDNSVLWTLSHELTHHLANTDTEAYAALRTAIETALKDSKLTTTELEDRGFEYDLDRVDPYIAREGNLWDALVAFEREEHGYGKDAEEEVVARCCESFLGFDQFVKDFARKQYKSAKAVNKFIAQMNIDMQRVSEEARQSAAQRNVWNDESPENQILRQLTEIDRIANLWRIAVNAEAKKRREAREETRASTKDSVKRSDAEYFDLARRYESGDKSVEAELRKAVDAAAKANGYVYGRAYHGTDYYKDITVFKRGKGGYLGSGIYFSDRQDAAQRYANRMGDGGKVYDAFLKIDNPLKVTSADPAQEILRAAYGNDRVYDERVRKQTNQSQLIQKKDIAKLQSKGYDGIIWKLERGVETEYSVFDSKQVKSADLITKDDSGNIIPLSERFNTKNEDIRYSVKDNVERKYTPETTMTMQQAKRMLEMTFNANGFRGYKGYKTADEWLQSEGAAEVAWYAENTETVVDQYFNRFPELTDYEVTIEEVLEAYQNGTLVGKEKTAKETIDLKTGNGYKDRRFYAPKLESVTEETIRTANLRVTSTNRDKVYAARRDVLFAAHTEEGIAALGLTQKELNKRLQNWSRYSERARTLSMKLNQGVAEEYWWTGLQNSSILSTINVTDQDIRSLVKDIIGTSSEYQRNYIGRTMLALDTHIDWSELTFEFTRTNNAKEGARGYYDDNNRHIAVGSSGYLNTVAHEMGHALDYKWGRDLFTKMSVPITQQHASNESKIASEEGRKFYHHFAEFSQKVEDACDIRSSYTQRGTEAFARFVARFVEWTANTAGSQSNYEAQYYNDRFTTGLYLEFVQILQEKARLDSMARNETRSSKMDKVRLSTADGTRTYTLGDVTAKLYGNDVELDGGNVRQRVQMMEAIAEVNGTARVDAASEAEAEAFRRAGAEEVVEELEGHGAKYGTWEFKYEERKFTNDSRYDIKQKQKFAKNILKQVGKSNGFTQAQRVKYGAALGRLMDYLWEMQYGKMDGKVVFEFADRLFDSILNDYTALSEADEEFRSELLANMTKTKNAKGSTVYVLEVNDKQMREIKYAYENAMAYASKLSKALGARVTVKQTENAKTPEDIFTNSTDTRIKSDTNEGDMPGELLRLVQETESRKTNPYAAESEERQALKMGMFEAAMAAAGVEKSTAQQIREAVKEARKAERTKAKTEARKAIDSARLAERMHEGALRAKDRRVSENRERALKQHAADREAKLKQGFRETTQKANETRLKRDMRTIALKWNQRLVKLLANPTENAHVPVQLAQAVSEYAQRLNELLTTRVPMSGENAGIEKQTKKGALNAQKIIDALNRSYADEETIAALKAEDPSFDPRGLIPVQYDENGHIIKDETLVKMINGMDSIIQGKHLSELTEDELRFVLNTMRGVIHTVTEANKVTVQGEQRNVYRESRQMANEVNSATKVFGDKSNKITQFMNRYVIESLGLRRIAKLYSGSNENAVFVKMVDDLNEGALEQERIKQTLRGMFNEVTTKYAKEMDTWYGKNAEWIDTGFGFKITKGMRVSLAMHILNAQNLRNVEKAGLRIPDMKAYRKGNIKEAYKNGKVVRLTKAQAQQIVDNMTEAEKAYFEVAKEFFHKRAGFYINRTSLKLLGYSKAIVENYFPIQTDDAYRTVKYDDVRQNASVEHPGFLESRKGTANVMYLNDITAVVNRQIDGVAKYAGLAIPMRNWNNIMNAWLFEENEDGEWVRSDEGRAHDVLERRMGYTGKGKAIIDYVDQFITDLTSPWVRDANENVQAAEFAAKITSNYVKAVLTLNARVALSQLASVPTAAAEIPWKYIVQSFGGNVEGHLNRNASNDLIDQYTPIFAMRRAGTQTEVSEVMKRKGFADKAEQKLPGLLGWITGMDVMATRRLWYACERWVKGETDIPVGSDAFYKEVARRYNRVIQNTQPNFTVLQRSPALRSKNAAARIITMFGTQRMQNAGVFIESFAEVVQAKNKTQRKAALKKFGRSLSGMITAALVIGLERAIVAALRGRMKPLQDDDKDITVKSVSKYIMNEIGTTLAGSFMYVGEAYDFVQGIIGGLTEGDSGYETSFALPAAEALSTMIEFFRKKDWQYFSYMRGDHTDHEKWLKTRSFINELMTVVGYATGLPLANASKTILNGWVPLAQDISDAIKTGELNPWLHQSGKLDKKTTNANYKEWTNNGFKGSEYFYWENVLSQYGKREEKIPILLEADLPNEKKAMLLRMMDKSGATSEGTVVYKSNGDVLIDFANPTEKQQALPMPTAETEETATPTTTPTATPQPTENPLTDARQEGVKEAVAKGVPEQTAFDAFLAYQDMGKRTDDNEYSRNDEFREWLFKNVQKPEDRAILEYQVIGQASKVEGAVTYRESGVVYRDYTNEAWFKLSQHNLAKDGTNKRYDAGKKLEQTGLSVDKTVAIYDGLAQYSKKAEWKNYLKEQGLTDEQITIFLWSRGWAKLN